MARNGHTSVQELRIVQHFESNVRRSENCRDIRLDALDHQYVFISFSAVLCHFLCIMVVTIYEGVFIYIILKSSQPSGGGSDQQTTGIEMTSTTPHSSEQVDNQMETIRKDFPIKDRSRQSSKQVTE